MNTVSRTYIEKKGKLVEFGPPIYVDAPTLDDVRARLADLCDLHAILFITREIPDAVFIPLQ